MPYEAEARVLVVDDERLVLGAMQRILRRYEVTVSESLAEARFALEAGSFDAVVSDVELRDGLESNSSRRFRPAIQNRRNASCS